MARRAAKPATSAPDRFFTRQLVGETSPSFSTMNRLYELSGELFRLTPWHVLSETELVVTRDSATGETCFCSVMGVLGEMTAVYAYIGMESYRLFRRVLAEEVSGPGDYYATQRSVYVNFVPAAELDAQDRKLLKALGHDFDKAQASPVFRACRPGFLPWYITEQEALWLEECLGAVLALCSAVIAKPSQRFWERADTYPILLPVPGKDGERLYRVQMLEAKLPKEPNLEPAELSNRDLARLRNRDYMVRGILELDHFPTSARMGAKNERKSLVSLAIAVESDTGFLHPNVLPVPGASVADELAMAIVRAVEARRAMPKEVRVRNRRFQECLMSMADVCGFSVKVDRALPALAEAREGLMRMMAGEPLDI